MSVADRRRDPWWQGVPAALLAAFYPLRCAGCQTLIPTGSASFCPTCQPALLPLTPPWCEQCGLPGAAASCPDCAPRPRSFRCARAPLAYGGPLEEAIHRFKFEGALQLARPLAAYWPAQGLPGIGPTAHDLLIPVPLHARRLRERGYNQALLLARELGRRWSLPVDPTSLTRQRATAAQSGLNATERQANLAGAFHCQPTRVRAQRILLIDDVITTGSTVDECAATLLSAGAAQVDVLALARTIKELMP